MLLTQHVAIGKYVKGCSRIICFYLLVGGNNYVEFILTIFSL